jgi:chemotaxis signal transduction protein
MNQTPNPSHSATSTLGDFSEASKHCVFRSGASWFSLPAISVREISITPELVRIPNCHDSLAGVCHLRSEFIPVISLTALLNIDTSQHARPHNQLMVIDSTNVWALLVAETASLETLETIVAPDARMDDASQSAVMGTAMFRDQIVYVLEPNSVFRIAQQTLEHFWASPNQPLPQFRSE